jgi:hypothetical protein
MPRKKDYKGRCFEAAFDVVVKLKLKDPVVVHGFIREADTPLWIVHAWVEEGGLVYDLTMQQEPIPKDEYYSQYGVHKFMWRYSKQDFLKQAIKKNYRHGPFDPVLAQMCSMSLLATEHDYQRFQGNRLPESAYIKTFLI